MHNLNTEFPIEKKNQSQFTTHKPRKKVHRCFESNGARETYQNNF